MNHDHSFILLVFLAFLLLSVFVILFVLVLVSILLLHLEFSSFLRLPLSWLLLLLLLVPFTLFVVKTASIIDGIVMVMHTPPLSLLLLLLPLFSYFFLFFFPLFTIVFHIRDCYVYPLVYSDLLSTGTIFSCEFGFVSILEVLKLFPFSLPREVGGRPGL